jgi:hypothetical protein
MRKQIYIHVLRHLMGAVRRKRPEKWRTIRWFLIHENAPAHRSALVMDFLAKNKVTTLGHFQHFPDQAPADFYPLSSTEISTERMALL